MRMSDYPEPDCPPFDWRHPSALSHQSGFFPSERCDTSVYRLISGVVNVVLFFGLAATCMIVMFFEIRRIGSAKYFDMPAGRIMSLAVGSSIGFGIYYWLFTFLNDETDIVLNGVWWIATQFALVAAHIVCHTCMSISIDSREMTPKTKLGGRADAVRKRLKTYFFVVRGLSLVGSGIASSLSCYYMSARNRAGATWAIWTAILIWGVDLGHLAAMTRWSGKELGKAIQEATDGITHSASAVAAVHDLRQISTRIQRNSTTIVILTFSLIAGIFVCIVFIHVTYDTQTSAGILLYLLPIFSVVVGSTIFCIVWTFGLRQLFRGYQAVYTPDASISIAKDYI